MYLINEWQTKQSKIDTAASEMRWENKSQTTKGPINVHVATIFITDIKIGFKRLYYLYPAFNREQSWTKEKIWKKMKKKTHKKAVFCTEKENYTPDINPRWCSIDYWDLSWKYSSRFTESLNWIFLSECISWGFSFIGFSSMFSSICDYSFFFLFLHTFFPIES